MRTDVMAGAALTLPESVCVTCNTPGHHHGLSNPSWSPGMNVSPLGYNHWPLRATSSSPLEALPIIITFAGLNYANG